MSVDPIVIVIVVAYLLGMLAVGWWASRRVENNDDFLVAGRRMGPWLLAGSLAATEVGGGSTLGVVERAYGDWGFSALWYIAAMAVAFMALIFIAPLFRRSMVKTVPEYFRTRYGKQNGLLSALILILPMVGLTASQLIASGTILAVMTGWSYTSSVLIVTVVVGLYSVLGGMYSVIYTDVVQWFFIIVGMLAIIPFAMDFGGGFAEINAGVPEAKWSLVDGVGLWTIVALSVMYIASFSVGQEAVQRFYSARDEKAARGAALITATVYGAFALVPPLIGVLMYGMVQNGQIDAGLLEVEGTQFALPVMAMQVLPSLIVGLLFAALISATMSSASSNLLAAGSIFTNDFYRIYFKKDASDTHALRVIRATMAIVCILSVVIAVANVTDLITLLVFSFTLRAGGAFIPYVVGHVWERASATGSMLSLIFGSLTVALVENQWIAFLGEEPIFPGLAVSALAFLLGTWFFPREVPRGAPETEPGVPEAVER
jgi:solute:Na+ symporter, SSS family